MELLKNKLDLFKQGYYNDKLILEAQVCVGLELVAVREIIYKLKIDENDRTIWYRNGSLFFCSTIDEFKKVQLLRSVESVNLVVDIVVGLNLTGNTNDDKNELVKLGLNTDILYSVKRWALLSQFKGIVDNKYEYEFGETKKIDTMNEPKNLRFRVTCRRTGCHSFNSRVAEAQFGGAILDKCGWAVSLTNWKLNVLLNIRNDNAYITLYIQKLALEDLKIRNSIYLGPTSLKSTVAHAMLRVARIIPGDHVVDLLCDCGSVTIECLYSNRNITLSSGDFRYKKSFKTHGNIVSQPVDLPKQTVFIWENLLKLPFLSYTIDVVLFNLAYFNNMQEVVCDINHKKFSRILTRKTGRIVVLTREFHHFLKICNYSRPECIWRIIEKFDFCIRNVNYSIFIAYRKNVNRDDY